MKKSQNAISTRLLATLSANNRVHTCLLTSLALILLPVHFISAEESLCVKQPADIINANTFSTDGKTHLQSDKVIVNETDLSSFTGNVVIQQEKTRIETEQAQYQKQTEQVEASGNVRFITPTMEVKSKTARFNLKSDQAILEKSEYQSLTSRARGEASKLEIKDPNTIELSDATYTTCDKEQTDWLMSASKIKLDNKTHQGHASHVVLRFKDVPFFYFPYLRFPLGEERLSGFLFPYFGSSDEHGSELKIPYYWNIHPQLDATITPHYMSKRGTLLHTEFRYLTENNHGTLTAEYLNKDKIFKDKRERLHWKHQSKPGLGWQANAEYNYIADNNHFIDFSNDLNDTSTTYLLRTANVAYNSKNWLLNIKAENHQILTGTITIPYKRMPQVTLNSRYAVKNKELNYSLKSEAVRFDHVDKSKYIGERVHIKPTISYPIRSAAGFIEPKLSLQYTSYNLQQTTGETHLSRTVPSFSLNSGLFFERDSQLFNSNYIQTLEPQLFYLYVPYQDQSALPVFDTSAYAFNVNQSLADYRFNGIDRIGDDNRLTTALATRFIDQQNGQEVFMAKVGQIYYFADRKVQLLPTAIDTGSRSNLIAELKAQPGNWKYSSQLEWDPELKVNVSSSNQLGYKNKKFNINLAHRYQRDALETHEMKMNWELSSRWQLHTNYLYDIRDSHIVENLVGINYESCCWGLKLSGKQRYLSSTQIDRGIYLELVLKGLGGFGVQQ